MKNNIPTVEEFIEQTYSFVPFELDQITELMREFAKIHVEAALKEASEKAEITYTVEKTWDFTEVDKDSILNSYPLTNIN
jgi:hypothetical protein